MNSASEANELSELRHFLRLFQSGSALRGISLSSKLTCIDEYVLGSVSSPVGSPHVTPSKQQSSASHSNVESAGVYTPGNVYHPSRTNASRHVYHPLSTNTSGYEYRLSGINISGHVYGMDSYATEKKYSLRITQIYRRI